MSEKVIGVGIIGFGRIGVEHANWLASSTRERVLTSPVGLAVTVADPTPDRQAIARQRKLKVCDTADELLADAAVQAVLIATPTAMHFDQAKAVLEAGNRAIPQRVASSRRRSLWFSGRPRR